MLQLLLSPLESNSLEILDIKSSQVKNNNKLIELGTSRIRSLPLNSIETKNNSALFEDINNLNHANSNKTIWTSEIAKSSPIFPPYAIAIVVILGVFIIMTSVFIHYLCRCMARRKKRENQLAHITPKSPDPRMVGIKPNQPIQFVVPTTILVGGENTEDSVSETDYSSSGANMLPIILGSRRKQSTSKYHINPDDLQHGLYEGVKATAEKGSFLGDLGKVGFSLCYNSLRNQLLVKLIGARDLPCHFLKTTANPCVKMVLLPERTIKYMSKIQRNTMNPIFNETFIFNVRRDDLADKKLKISIYDYDKFSRKCLIGQVIYSIQDSGLVKSMIADSWTGDLWVDLKPDSSSTHSGVGEMLFSLCYNAPNLTLTILKVRGLSMQQDREKNPFVYAKVTLYVRRKLVRTKKTPTKLKTPQVEFNSSFDVHVPPSSLGEVDFMVILCEKASGLGSRRIIGRTQVGANCLSDQGLQHWQDMLMSPKSTCAQWHVLCT